MTNHPPRDDERRPAGGGDSVENLTTNDSDPWAEVRASLAEPTPELLAATRTLGRMLGGAL